MSTYVYYVLVGVGAGLASALLGIGGGVIMVPMLVMLFAMEPHRATATSLAWIAPIALTGALLGWYHHTPPRWGLVLLAVPGGIAGSFAGRWIAAHIPGAYVRVAFALLLILVGVRMGWNGLQDLRPPADRAPATETDAQSPR